MLACHGFGKISREICVGWFRPRRSRNDTQITNASQNKIDLRYEVCQTSRTSDFHPAEFHVGGWARRNDESRSSFDALSTSIKIECAFLPHLNIPRPWRAVVSWPVVRIEVGFERFHMIPTAATTRPACGSERVTSPACRGNPLPFPGGPATIGPRQRHYHLKSNRTEIQEGRK